MSLAINDRNTRAAIEPGSKDPTTLLDVLHNSLILTHIVPYLPPSSILGLASANHTYRSLILHSPGVFRHLDLSKIKAAQFNIDQIDHGGQVWRNVQLDENLTEDDFYSGPLRGIFSTLKRRNILQDVQTLILDGLSVTSDLAYDIINDSSYNVRILSLRDVRNLNHAKLRSALQYACRPSRPEASPRLKGLYIFGKKDTDPKNEGEQNALVKGDAWWNIRGRIYPRALPDEWARCLVACQGLIAFDAVLCQGPRHSNSSAFGKHHINADSRPAVATVAVSGCHGCGKAPEGVMSMETCAANQLPLLAPLPIMASSLRAATLPGDTTASFVPRCMDCLNERHCTGCDKWWCEACYMLPGQSSQQPQVQIMDDSNNAGMSLGDYEEWDEIYAAATKFQSRLTKSCWECGNNCSDCISKTQRACRKCCAGYCIVHNEGSSSDHCDWCVSRGRGLQRGGRMAVTGGRFKDVCVAERLRTNNHHGNGRMHLARKRQSAF